MPASFVWSRMPTKALSRIFELNIIKLHNFGIDKLIWILTASRQVIVGVASECRLLIDWNKDIEIMNGITFNIGSYLKMNGIELEDNL
jgi:hypothetical protein